MKIDIRPLALKVSLFCVLAWGFVGQTSQAQCLGSIPLPMPATGIDALGNAQSLSVPLGTLDDIAGRATGILNGIGSPINIPIIGSLLPPLPISSGIGGFIKEFDFSPVNQVTKWLQGLEGLLGPSNLLGSLGICDIKDMNLTKPTIPDMNEYWGSPETNERQDHLESAYNTNVSNPNFAVDNVQSAIPNKGGASIGSVIATYTKTQIDAAWNHLLINQFNDPVNFVFPDSEVQCRPKIRLFGFCFPLPGCLPGVSYNHVESVYNVHRPGHHALVPDILVQPMMELIKTAERATSNWLPFITIVMNKEETHAYWGSRNPEMVNNMAAAMFMATQDEITQKVLEQNIKAQDMSGLLLPFVGDAFTVTALPSVLSTGSIPLFGTLPIPGLVKKRSLALSAFPVHPFIRTWKDTYKPGYIDSPDINPSKYFELRSMVPTLLNTDSKKYEKVIKNMYAQRFAPVAQSQELDEDSIWEYSRLPKNTGGLLMQPEVAPYDKMQKPSVNPLSLNNCFSFRGRTLYPETTFANSTARVFGEVNQAIFAEQRSCKAGPGKCPGPRDSYVPYDKRPQDFRCSSEYGETPDPGTKCIYDEYQLHNTHAAGIYKGSVLPENQYPKDENDLKESESALISHYHRQRDCADEEFMKSVFPIFCGWAERCNDKGQFEPAPNCAATQRFDPGMKVPRTGCF
jgi:hypothetical protein